MRRAIHAVRALALAALLLSAAACEPSSPGDGVEPGDLSVRLTAPDANARAVTVTVTGPGQITDARAASAEHVAHARVSGGTLRAAVFGERLEGAVLLFRVPDVRRASEYRATVTEAVDADNLPRADAAAFRATVER